MGIKMGAKLWNALNKPFLSKKGSPTMEYVIIIAVGVIFAGLVFTFIKDGGVTSIITEKITKALDGSATVPK
ncbi:hypothetical protein [Hazenella coriacea]|uniref:Pilus assembly protein Flp/PilA n=1 Tax=Hazenella coriacea TaxID=1179467 RepID=A0A4R3L604_9BACL|nr:hypothetical protein [Hazenella coriacea]TCS94260.1 hypothetical protein EDD58_104129 [Hazenella coriacea]